MTRDAVTVTTLTKHNATAIGAGVTINTTNGAVIAAVKKARKLLLRVSNTITNATKVVTIKAGVYPPAALMGQGDLALTVQQSDQILVTLETARFLQADGTINVDFGTGMTGAIAAYVMPNTV